MNTCVLIYMLCTLQFCVLSVKVNNFVDEPSVLSAHKEELPPLLISCGLNDIIIISAPIINNHTKYYLSNPNGDTIKLLNITPRFNWKALANEKILIRLFKNDVEVIYPANQYEIFNVNDGVSFIDDGMDVFGEREQSMDGNQFMIGPLGDNDHGNWILSAYYQEQDAKWVEVFQVITVEIVEIVPANIQKPAVLSIGDDFELSFKYPIHNIQSCEITAPRSTFDRFYTRSRHNIQFCGFLIPNITREDRGLWRIIGVGNIVYKATAFLTIKDDL